MTQTRGGAGKDDVKGQAVRVAELLNYQDEAIVSRTLLESKAGTVTLFAFDGGQGLSEHTAPYDAMVYVLEGEMVISISGNPLRVAQGGMLIMPADKPHALRAHERAKMMLVMIRS